MHLNDAFGRSKELKYTCCHHEQACAIAAEGYARVSGRLAVVNPTTGPGCLNALTGVFGAWTDSVPMLVVSGQVKRENVMSTYEGLNIRQLGDQEIDIIPIARPITKYAVIVREAERIRYELEKAFYYATNGRPGPCWIDVPVDVQSAQIDPETLEGYTPPSVTAVADPHYLEKEIDVIVERLKRAKRPVILAGNGVRVSQMREEFELLVKELHIPVVGSRSAVDILPITHPCYMGRSGVDADRVGNFVVQNSDFLLVLGSRLGVRQIGYNRESYARDAFIAHVDIDSGELGKPTLTAKTHLKVNADLRHFIPLLRNRLRTEKEKRPDCRDWIAWGKEKQSRYYGVRSDQRIHKDGINPYGFLEEVYALLRDDDIIVCANGAAFIMTSHTARLRGRQRFFFNSGCASMGFDLPAAIGAATAAGTGRRVICFAGDGSFQMNVQELQTLKHQGLNVIIIVINNGGYLSIRTTQEGFFGFRVGESADTGVSFPNFANVAHAYGIPSTRIEDASFQGQLKTALERNGPYLIEVIVDPKQKFEPRLTSKQLPGGKIVSPPLEDMFPHLSDEEMKECLLIPPAKYE